MDPATENTAVPDLRFLPLARLAREHWRSNPLCARVWRSVRPWAAVLMLLQTASVGFALWVNVIGPGMGGAPMLPSLSWLAVYGGLCLTGLVSMAVWVAAPILYARWAYRRFHLTDEMLRATTLGRTERWMGIMVPALVVIIAYSLPSVLGTPLASVAAGYNSAATGFPLFGGPVSLALAGVAAASSAVVGCLIYLMQFPTFGLRALLLDSHTGQANGRRWGSVVVAYLLGLGMSMTWGMLRSLPVMAITLFGTVSFAMTTAKSGAPPAGPPNLAQPGWAWALAYLWMLAADVFGVWLMRVAMAYFWRRDIPLARRALFDPPEPARTLPWG